jgi:hypothetical protein
LFLSYSAILSIGTGLNRPRTDEWHRNGAGRDWIRAIAGIVEVNTREVERDSREGESW